MRDIFYRFIAMMLLAVPGILAAYGFLQIKDALFLYFSAFGDASAEPALNWRKIIWGLVLFVFGIAFIGGWIFYRDRKRNYVAPRFKKDKH
jgi:hypothetical protein